MTIRQAGAPVTDAELAAAADENILVRTNREEGWRQTVADKADKFKCRLFPKVAFFFDGTSNNMDIELKKEASKQELTNIATLYRSAINEKEREAFPRYFSGVGTPFKVDQPLDGFGSFSDDTGGNLGLGFGAGGDLRVRAARMELCRIVTREYSDSKPIEFITLSIFGFSRGATIARAFLQQLMEKDCTSVKDGLGLKIKGRDPVRLRINFMGLFDTVASVGAPGAHRGYASKLAIPREVERCLHLVSAHEVRKAFPLDSVRVGQTCPGNCDEVVYPGVHCDVGGGYSSDAQGRDNQLSRIPLREMYKAALEAGVMLTPFARLKNDVQMHFTLPPDSPVAANYNAYMGALPNGGEGLENLIQAHRAPFFRYRRLVTEARNRMYLLGSLGQAVPASVYEGMSPAAEKANLPDQQWRDNMSAPQVEQAQQLIAAQKQLENRVQYLRNPQAEEVNQRPGPRALTDYETKLLAAWDDPAPVPMTIYRFMSQHVHDSVAHFSGWPCALHDQRGLYSDSLRTDALYNPGKNPTILV
ncbi:T6SS phospholipase effector Tle1-like catalytic domain-containing protein [Silvimonas soli]|uniref:T6SS phospholipase effector Tle1-like catalytic domain-containing protein n=1 Tax=Silvimonas soli TaxID=2980100 RepID=UPI0024B348C1|nr:DUF2235 domain-containing protein [Silvimonas soli]